MRKLSVALVASTMVVSFPASSTVVEASKFGASCTSKMGAWSKGNSIDLSATSEVNLSNKTGDARALVAKTKSDQYWLITTLPNGGTGKIHVSQHTNFAWAKLVNGKYECTHFFSVPAGVSTANAK